MIKKFLNVFMCLGLIIQTFLVIIPVMASENDLIEYFDVELIYTNFENDVNIYNQHSYWYNYNGENLYEVKTRYYNVENEYLVDENTLSLDINGTNYQEKDYTLNIKIIDGIDEENPIYTKSVNVNGNELNNGYRVELVELNKKFPTSLEQLDEYHIIVNIDNQTRDIYYAYKKEIVNVSSTLFFDNTKSLVPLAAGLGTMYGFGRVYNINKDVFSLTKPMYMYYKGKNFNNEKVYEYYFYSTDKGLNEFNKSENQTIIYSGNIKGNVLNTKGLMLKLTNKEKYNSPTYILVIKDGEYIISQTPDYIEFTDAPSMTNIELRTNRNLYLKMDNYNYIATTNTPISIKVGGVGFDNNKKYSVLLLDNLYEDDYNGGNGNRVEYNQQIIEATGYELNNMLVNFKSKLKKIEIGYTQAIIIDIYEAGQVELDENGYIIEHSAPIVMNEGDPILISFLDSRDFFEKKSNYIIDNTRDIIKNILKKTDVSDFVDNIEIKDNGKVKIYDNTGQEEISGNIGTGMKAKVFDEYDYNLLDLDVVVKGDVSGDGNISITDLVKVKRHLAEEENLTGVYEVAGNITDTGEIGITDLVKISRDVAKIEEVK